MIKSHGLKIMIYQFNLASIIFVGKCKPPEGAEAPLVIRTEALEKKETPKVKKRKESVAMEGMTRRKSCFVTFILLLAC